MHSVSEQPDSTAASATAVPLTLDRGFRPCAVEPGDECFPNGIFVFNISRLQAWVDANPASFAVEWIAVADLIDYASASLDEDTVRGADLSRPILLAEIAPGRYNVIDGHHRLALARRNGVATVPGRRIACPHHVPFLTSTLAYERYVEYWNAKLQELQPKKRPRRSGARGRGRGETGRASGGS